MQEKKSSFRQRSRQRLLRASKHRRYTQASENLGSLVINEKTGEPEIIDLGVDAQLNLERGVVVTTVENESIPEEAIPIFGPDNCHNND